LFFFNYSQLIYHVVFKAGLNKATRLTSGQWFVNHI
jgi:hypothetical protein